MANQNAPFGLGAITRSGSSFIGDVNKYYIPASDTSILSVGDPVISGGSADADGLPSITRASTGDAVRGYVVGFTYDRANEDLPNLRAASTERYALVCDDPMARVVVQANGDLTANDVGQNIDFVVADADPVTGRSQVQLDTGTVGTGETKSLKLLELYQSEDNVIGTNARWVCSFNTHELKSSAGSTGV